MTIIPVNRLTPVSLERLTYGLAPLRHHQATRSKLLLPARTVAAPIARHVAGRGDLGHAPAARAGKRRAGGPGVRRKHGGATRGSPAPQAPPPRPGSDSFQAVCTESATTIQPRRAPVKRRADGARLETGSLAVGWTPERFAQFSDGEPLTDAERDELVQLLWRVRTFDVASIEAWSATGPALRHLARIRIRTAAKWFISRHGP